MAGYYLWLDKAESQQEDPRLEPMLVDMLRYWDLRNPLLYIEPSPESTSTAKTAAPQTTVNLVLGIISAQNLLVPGTAKSLAIVEYMRPGMAPL
jgi:hypothetical protein